MQSNVKSKEKFVSSLAQQPANLERQIKCFIEEIEWNNKTIVRKREKKKKKIRKIDMISLYQLEEDL